MRPPLTPPEILELRMSDGYVVRARWWPGQPGQRGPRPPLLYLHGIQSHGGWYEWSGSLLAAAGLPVLMPDRRGSGLNDAARGDTPGMERWLDDLDELAAALRMKVGPQRVALVGVSWGGKPAVAWALRRPAQTAAVLLIAPGLFPQVGVGFVAKLRIGVELLGGARGRHAIPLDDPALFTENPPGQDFIRADALKLTTATARLLYESNRLDRLLVRAAAGALDAPATLLLAEHDRIIRNKATERWLWRVCRRPPLVVTLPGTAHTIEFEPDVGPFEEQLQRWAAGVTPAGRE